MIKLIIGIIMIVVIVNCKITSCFIVLLCISNWYSFCRQNKTGFGKCVKKIKLNRFWR